MHICDDIICIKDVGPRDAFSQKLASFEEKFTVPLKSVIKLGPEISAASNIATR